MSGLANMTYAGIPGLIRFPPHAAGPFLRDDAPPNLRVLIRGVSLLGGIAISMGAFRILDAAMISLV